MLRASIRAQLSTSRHGSTIELKPEDRGTLQSMAKRYRVKSLTRLLEGGLSAEDRQANPGTQVLLRIYED